MRTWAIARALAKHVWRDPMGRLVVVGFSFLLLIAAGYTAWQAKYVYGDWRCAFANCRLVKGDNCTAVEVR